jgi:hypothetical protein
MDFTNIGELRVSRLLIGSNPFSGFSHQGIERDELMVHYYTVARIKEALFEAERLGMTGMLARTDFHMMRTLLEYRDEGGKLQWFAQTCPEVGDSEACVRRAARGGAVACHIHGGVMDHLVSNGRASEVAGAVQLIRSMGMKAGIAGHVPAVFEWAEKNLDVDYYMCCYYNPTPRANDPEHVHGAEEQYLEEDRQAMTGLIPTLSRPVIHYKILAAGRNNPDEAFKYCAAHMRPQDLACIGVFTGDDRKMIETDVRLFEKHSRPKTGEAGVRCQVSGIR